MLKITLTAARVNAGFTLEDVAKRLHKSKRTIISWEKGNTPISAPILSDLCELYKVPIGYINLPCNSTLSGKEGP